MIRTLFLAILLINSITIVAQKNNSSAIVLELFTSQGCSSCPAADELLDTIKKEYTINNVFVLSYHVDYWNRLGWKDPFSSSVYSDYQRAYALKFNSRSIYTPQLVVNGDIHFAGSHKDKAIQAIKKYQKSKTTTIVTLTNAKKRASEITVDYMIKGDEFDKLTLALVVSERSTKISRGENRSRTIKNSNIVASRVIKMDDSGSAVILIPDWVSEKDSLSIIAYTQNTALIITGASNIKI